MTTCKNLSDCSIIVVLCMTLRDEILATKINGYSNLEIESDSKIVIDSFNKMIGIPCSIILINGGYPEVVSRAKCISLLLRI